MFISASDGAGVRRLTDDAPRDRLPVWAPDGKTLSFYSNRVASNRVALPLASSADGLALAPDGRTIYDGGRQEADIRGVERTRGER